MNSKKIPTAMKNELARANGKLRERYIQRVKEEGKQFIRTEEENARLRKAVYMLMMYMQKNHPEIVNEAPFAEMVEYFEGFESIKDEVRSELGMVAD